MLRRATNLLTPSQTAILGLLGSLMAGSVLLWLPISQAPGVKLKPIEAVFTATSALCVTGLTVVDTGSQFSLFGTLVIFLLFQVGGLGMLLWSTTMIVLLGGQIGLSHRLLMKDQLPGISMSGAGRLSVRILGFVMLVELLGALALWVCWHERVPGLEGFFYAFYHSASAFCNAGFSLWPDSLAQDVADPVVNITVMLLVTLGSLGYAVVTDVYQVMRGLKSRTSVHSRLVLVLTLVLFVGGALLFFLFEYNHQGILAHRPWAERILIPMFHSAGRTAGLSTVDFSSLKPETLQLMMALMFIGGSSGSTAGGLKTTTLALLLLAAWSQVRGKEEVEVFERRIHGKQVTQAVALTMIASVSVLSFAFILNFLEPRDFSDILFETISGLAIVGFSTGITPEMTDLSKGLLCIAMLVGRVGPLTLALSLLKPKRRASIRRPVEDVIIG